MQLSSTSLLNWIWEKIVLDKQLLRKIMKEKRLALTSQTFSLYNQQILSKVLTHPRVQEAKIIGCYVSLPREVDTLAIIQTLLLHKRVCVPKVEGSQMNFYEIHSLDELHSGCFHVLEPVTSHFIEPGDIDCMLVPLLAYDQNNYRVGYGKGYYDRYFQRNFHGYKMGLAFSFQYVDHIDYDVYDYPLDEIIHEMS